MNMTGTMTQTFWKKKSKKELAKLREKTLGIRLNAAAFGHEQEGTKWKDQ